jgi:hypothetical protein
MRTQGRLNCLGYEDEVEEGRKKLCHAVARRKAWPDSWRNELDSINVYYSPEDRTSSKWKMDQRIARGIINALPAKAKEPQTRFTV